MLTHWYGLVGLSVEVNHHVLVLLEFIWKKFCSHQSTKSVMSSWFFPLDSCATTAELSENFEVATVHVVSEVQCVQGEESSMPCEFPLLQNAISDLKSEILTRASLK